jgi:hypothetical protein
MKAQLLNDGVPLIDLELRDCSDLESYLGSAWPLVIQAVKGRFKSEQPQDVDRLRIYVRYESGMLWFALETLKPKRLASVAGVKIAGLETLYYGLPDPGQGQAVFEQAHALMAERIYAALRRSITKPEASEALAPLRQWLPLITVVDYDDLETERPL